MTTYRKIASMALLICVTVASFALGLSGCAQETVRVGSKDFAENEILAEMFALLLEDAGLKVERRIPLGDTDVTFEALRNGSIDLYPEYTGTGLLMLGLAGTPDSEQAYSVVAREFSDVGLTVLDRLGFENSYALIVTSQTATKYKLDSVADLSSHSLKFRIGVTEEFARRPTDGLQPLLDHFALSFAQTHIVPSQHGHELYDKLLDRDLDVIVGLQTDPQIADYQLQVLDAKSSFFPAYDAVPLVSHSVLARSPAIATALNRLSSKLDASRVRRLNSKVILSGQAPRKVAREAMLELGFLSGWSKQPVIEIRLAIDPAEAGSTMASNILRAARQTVPGYELTYLASATPVASMVNKEARVAVAPSISHFEFDGRQARLRSALETVAATGSVFVHVLARSDYREGLSKAGKIAAGPPGSAAHKLAIAMAAWHDSELQIVSTPDTSAQSAADALNEGRAEAAIVIATLSRTDLIEVFERDPDLTLLDASEWWVGAARLALPILSSARISDQTYAGVGAVQTLSMQLTVVGPSPSHSVVGHQGPSSFNESANPVTDKLVLAFNENLGPRPNIGPHLRRAKVLMHELHRTDTTLNRTPEHTILSITIIAYVLWCTWLLFSSSQDGSRKR